MTADKHPETSPETSPETPPENAEVRMEGARASVSAGQAASTPETPKTRLTKRAALRSPSRSARDELRYSLARRLTDRDRAIVRAVSRHRILTADQLTALFFDHRKTALRRLLDLHRMGVLDRFQPNRAGGGAHPFHYLLGPLGSAMVATDRGEEAYAAMRRWRPDRALVLARTQRLAHTVGVNGVYVSLAAFARRDGRARLTAWLTEAECAGWSEGIVRPDALGEWTEDGKAVEFLLEYDRGTESLNTIMAKLPSYEELEAERGVASWLLFALPSSRRETSVRRALAASTLAIATSVLDGSSGAQDAVWLSLRSTGPRLRLAQLADVPKPDEALRRAATGGPRAWRFDRSRYDYQEEAPIEI